MSKLNHNRNNKIFNELRNYMKKYVSNYKLVNYYNNIGPIIII